MDYRFTWQALDFGRPLEARVPVRAQHTRPSRIVGKMWMLGNENPSEFRHAAQLYGAPLVEAPIHDDFVPGGSTAGNRIRSDSLVRSRQHLADPTVLGPI
jgi:hypothetical protein